MALRRRNGGHDGLNAWPGYVDALSTLLMVIIFVLLVFILAQAFLSVALSGKDRTLDRLNRQMAEISDMLSLERERSGELRQSIAQLTRDLQSSNSAREDLGRQLAAVTDLQTRLAAERDQLRTQRDALTAQLSDSQTQSRSAAARAEGLQKQLGDIVGAGDAAASSLAATRAAREELERTVRADKATIEARLADIANLTAQLRAMQQARDELDRTVRADKATIEARLSDIARMAEQVRALTALREELEKQVRDATARALTDEQRRAALAAQFAEEQKYSDSARAQIALLNRQMEQLRSQLNAISDSLEIAEKSGRDKDAQIANLGSQLNLALAAKVEELQRYRSDFFGRLRQVLANRPGIQVVGDRFVFQSEVLFPTGSADLSATGSEEILKLANTLKQLAGEIPPDVTWVMRVDGHADAQPVSGGTFASNWELSAQRAINVVKLLVAAGVPANRLAATGFGDNQPLDAAQTPASYARNRRIELRLTDR